MQKSIIISVIVPTYNRSDLLNKCLSSLINQTFLKKFYEIIVIDDGSNDNTKNIVLKFKRKYPDISYFYQKNQGHSIARNKGISNSKGKFIAFTDDDCIVEKDWIKKIVKTFEKYPCGVAVGGSIENTIDTKLAWAAHILDFSSWQNYGYIRLVKDIPTANISYNKNKIKGLFFENDRCILGYRDSLFNNRLIKRGEIIIFNPNLRVYHCKDVKTFEEFLKIQRRRGLGFVMNGYRVHGLLGLFLIKFRYINLLCPRLIFIFYKCMKSKKLLIRFFKYFDLILRGEFERNKIIVKYKMKSWNYYD
ncbi:MAG: glycosyltransferase family 2 protein [Nanoarchaeota archaeon]|nr:glycosyltransferase family 2 protein [Nanoarchaeota archaeon]